MATLKFLRLRIQLNSYASALGFCLKEFLLAVAKTVLSATMKYAAPATAIELNNQPFFILVKKSKWNHIMTWLLRGGKKSYKTCGDYESLSCVIQISFCPWQHPHTGQLQINNNSSYSLASLTLVFTIFGFKVTLKHTSNRFDVWF